MALTLARIGRNETIKFAFDELMRLLREMDEASLIDGRVYAERDSLRKDIIWVGMDGSVGANDGYDEIFIDVENGGGIISGSNPRSVLIAVYRFMHSLGCRFLRPGKSGEKIPKRSLDRADINVKLHERASYRHRSMCIEGRVGYEHVRNMIDWLPKVGMNGYFVQFTTPGSFFKRFYNVENPHLPKINVTDDDVDRIWARLEEDISLRGLDYHATGHGWTCMPFGLSSSGWEVYDGEIPEKTVNCFAEIDGVRKLWDGKPLNTNLCYSNPYVRSTIADAMVRYCKEHPAVSFLHFWLADDKNNHCECTECRKMRPADWYVRMLNEIDEKLGKAKVTTKIVCLIYLDLLWAPEVEKIKNQDRFVLMFAPITRTYTTAFTDFDTGESVELAPYVRNRLVMPTSVAENVARLEKWQSEQLRGDSFDFDYHLMWDHYLDPGYYECARILHKDMTGLYKIGLNGMVSCQTNRAAFPTGLPMYAMAGGLWNRDSVFTDISAEYFTAAFADDAAAVEEYMKTLSELFCPAYMRGEKPISPDEMKKRISDAKTVIDGFEQLFITKNGNSSDDWSMLKHHAHICRMYADALRAGIDGDAEEAERIRKEIFEYLDLTEPELNECFDVGTFEYIWELYFPNLQK